MNTSFCSRKLSSVMPSWHFDQCHGREGVTAVKIIHNSIVITTGRQHGRVHRWRIVSGSGDGLGISLQPLDQILKPSNISWIGSFLSSPTGGILALGFISIFPLINHLQDFFLIMVMDLINSCFERLRRIRLN
ncbi:hypothetical protein ACTXT7_015606 [Hymenolepis weldensis]